MTKQKRERMTTPNGIAKYSWLNKPDTKFDTYGVCKVSLLFDPDFSRIIEI